MKVKKFKNLWFIGLIIFSSLLFVLYLLKLIFPEFVIMLAEIEPIVKFGNFIQSKKWLYLLFSFLISTFGFFFYCCACCRKKKLDWIDFIIIVIYNILILVVQEFLPSYYYTISMVCLIIIPIVICIKDKKTDIKYLYSTGTVYSIHTLSQMFSLEIRGLNAMITQPNIATLTILLIDVYIWLVLLYNYYNYKEDK